MGGKCKEIHKIDLPAQSGGFRGGQHTLMIIPLNLAALVMVRNDKHDRNKI